MIQRTLFHMRVEREKGKPEDVVGSAGAVVLAGRREGLPAPRHEPRIGHTAERAVDQRGDPSTERGADPRKRAHRWKCEQSPVGVARQHPELRRVARGVESGELIG